MRLTATLVTLASACLTAALSAQSTPTPASSNARIFNFSAVHAAQKLIEGTLTAYADSMVVSSEWGRCQPEESTTEQAAFARFKCSAVKDIEDLSLSFERAAPIHATWSGMPTRVVGKVLVVCNAPVGSSVPGSPTCARPTEMPAGRERKTPPVITGKLKVSEKK